MKFGYTIAYVRDVGETVEFWERAFGLKRRFVGENNEYAEMETGETALAFASNELGESNLPSGLRKDDLSGPPAGIEIVLIPKTLRSHFAPRWRPERPKRPNRRPSPGARSSLTCATPTGCSSRSAVRCSSG